MTKVDEAAIWRWLNASWSRATSSLWTVENPARGQCGVTALVIQDRYGGEILKTRDGQQRWHFYNRINRVRHDFTAEQFAEPIEYLDLPASRAEAFGDTNAEQYATLTREFARAASDRGRRRNKS